MISSLISFLTCCFFSSMVFILCVCAFPIFSSCSGFLVSYHCGRKECFELLPDKLFRFYCCFRVFSSSLK